MKPRFVNQKLGKRVSRKQELERVKISAQRWRSHSWLREPSGLADGQ